MARVSSREDWEQLGFLAEIVDEPVPKNGGSCFSDPSFASNKALPIHRWVPWIAGFSSSFVKDALSKCLHGRGKVLDPFSGVGTTLVEALLGGHSAIGFEINPYAALACRTKVGAHRIDVRALGEEIGRLRSFWKEKSVADHTPHSAPPSGFKTRAEFYSPKVLRKVLIVQDFIDTVADNDLRDLIRLAFASTMVSYSNYSYEPSLGRRVAAGREEIEDFPVFQTILDKLGEMAADIAWLGAALPPDRQSAEVINDSFLRYEQYIPAASVDLIVTSPPYLNNYHYNRNTRPHLYWLGLASQPDDLQRLEHVNFGKYWQTVRDKPCVDLEFSLPGCDMAQRLELLRGLNADKGIYGGSGWANYAASYFNDCYKFAQGIKYVLKPGGRALVVIGNSILHGVQIPTDQYFGQIAASIGLQMVDIHIPRATRVGNSIIQSEVRVAKAQRAHQLYEAVVELRRTLPRQILDLPLIFC